MPRHPDPYPKYMTVTDEGKSLYGIWRRVRNNTDKYCGFTEYPKFFNWAMDNYYVLGSRLRRYDESQPYTPNNCTFEPADTNRKEMTLELRKMANKWNRTVNVIRVAYGMEPFEVLNEEDLLCRNMKLAEAVPQAN